MIKITEHVSVISMILTPTGEYNTQPNEADAYLIRLLVVCSGI